MEDIFVRAVKLLKAKGYIKGENYFVNGTKIESASGQYPFVRDYLDLHDANFDVFFNNLNQYTAQKYGGGTPEWTHIPASARQELQDAYGMARGPGP
jgi:hypothetical protein